jgi:hypothetical protein
MSFLQTVSDAATRQALNKPTAITDTSLLIDVLFGAFAGLAVKEQQGIPNNVANMPVISERAETSGPIAAGSLVDLGRSKPAAKVSLADFPASSAGASQTYISETNPCKRAHVEVCICHSDKPVIQSSIQPVLPLPLVRLLDRGRLS